MTPPVATMKVSELLEACNDAGGMLPVDAPGYGTFRLVRDNPVPQEQPLSESDVASLKRGVEDFEQGRYSDADELVAKMRAKYGL